MDSGILLLISMENRDWAITTYGFGIQAFTDSRTGIHHGTLLPDLSNGDYAAALDRFTLLVDQFLTQAKTGSPYDKGNLPRTPLGVAGTLAAIGVGILTAWIIVSIMKSKLKSVRPRQNATDYVRAGSMKLTVVQDLFLYRTLFPNRPAEGLRQRRWKQYPYQFFRSQSRWQQRQVLAAFLPLCGTIFR